MNAWVSLNLMALMLVAVLQFGSIERANAQRQQAPSSNLKIAVTPPGYDDIGAILNDLGLPFQEINDADLSNYDFIKQFNVIFANCSNAARDQACDPQTAENLRKFVENGGTLYASDWAFGYIQHAFPGFVEFYGNDCTGEGNATIGEEGKVQAFIEDAKLREFLGRDTVEIDYDLGAWVPIKNVSFQVTVLLRGSFFAENSDQGFLQKVLIKPKNSSIERQSQYVHALPHSEKASPKKRGILSGPLAVTFLFGKGRVIYTTFHNHAQLAEIQKKLLEFFIFRLGEQLFISLSVDRTKATPSDILVYTLRFSNPLNVEAKNVVVSVNVPPTATFIAGSATGGGSFTNGTLTWQIGNLPPKTPERQVSFQLRPAVKSGVISVYATMTAEGVVPLKSPPAETVIINTRLTIMKVVDLAEVRPGDLLRYTITYANKGLENATGVTITDALPVGTTYISDDGGGIYDPLKHTLTWNVGKLAPQTEKQINLVVRVNDLVPTGISSLTNKAQIWSNEFPEGLESNIVTTALLGRIELSASPTSLVPNEVTEVEIAAALQDAAGNAMPNATSQVKFSLIAGGELVTLEGTNPASPDNGVARIRLKLRPGVSSSGSVEVKAEAEGFRDATIVVPVQSSGYPTGIRLPGGYIIIRLSSSTGKLIIPVPGRAPKDTLEEPAVFTEQEKQIITQFGLGPNAGKGSDVDKDGDIDWDDYGLTHFVIGVTLRLGPGGDIEEVAFDYSARRPPKIKMMGLEIVIEGLRWSREIGIELSGKIKFPFLADSIALQQLRVSPDGNWSLGEVKLSLPAFTLGGFGFKGIKVGIDFNNQFYYGVGEISIPEVADVGVELEFDNIGLKRGRLLFSGFKLPIGATGFILKGVRGEIQLPRKVLLILAKRSSIIPAPPGYIATWDYLLGGSSLYAADALRSSVQRQEGGGELIVKLGGTLTHAVVLELVEGDVDLEVSSAGKIEGRGALKVKGFQLVKVSLKLSTTTGLTASGRLDIPFDGSAELTINITPEGDVSMEGKGELYILIEVDLPIIGHVEFYQPLGEVSLSYQNGELRGSVTVKIVVPLAGIVLYEGTATVVIRPGRIELQRSLVLRKRQQIIGTQTADVTTMMVIFPGSQELGTQEVMWSSNIVRPEDSVAVILPDRKTAVYASPGTFDRNVIVILSSAIDQTQLDAVNAADKSDPAVIPLKAPIRCELLVKDAVDGTVVTSFNHPVTLVIFYPDKDNDGKVDEEVPPLDENNLALYRFDPTQRRWEKVDGVKLDPVANAIIADLSQPSIFSVLGSGTKLTHSISRGLSMVAVPATPTPGLRVIDALGLTGVTTKLARWNPTTSAYHRYEDNPDDPFLSIIPGQSVWVLIPSDTTLFVIGQPTANLPYSISLKAGWNQIGNPFLSVEEWNLSAIKVRCGSGEKTLSDAQAAGWIEDYAWGWEQDANNPNEGRYVLVYDISIIPGVKGQLEPWKGYWVYAHTDCELILPPPSQNKGRGTRGEGRVAKGNGWSMRLQASVNGSVGEALIGIANGTRGLAVGLPPEPPTGNNGVQVILLKNNTPLAVDVRSDGSRRQEWEVLVRFGTRDGGRGTSERKEVVLTFDGIGYAPKDVSAWLVDTVTGKRLYLRTQPSYRFVAQEGEVERKFKVDS
jgi:uncharacterized repeat protein (TIGR01451 family)